jgi:redox-sensitive bicupin YhaK (pirin superfamily)
MLDATLRAGAALSVPLPPSHNALAVVTSGRARAGGRSAGAGQLILFANDGGAIELAVEEDARVVILAGEPIDVPIVQYGPFVMNSADEIRQAVADVQSGEFGPIPESA